MGRAYMYMYAGWPLASSLSCSMGRIVYFGQNPYQSVGTANSSSTQASRHLQLGGLIRLAVFTLVRGEELVVDDEKCFGEIGEITIPHSSRASRIHFPLCFSRLILSRISIGDYCEFSYVPDYSFHIDSLTTSCFVRLASPKSIAT